MTTTPVPRSRRTSRTSRAVRMPPGWTPYDPADPPDDLVDGLHLPDDVLTASTTAVPARSGSRPALALARSPHGLTVDPALLDEEDHFVDEQGRTVRYRRWQSALDLRTVCESWAWTDGDGPVTELLAAVDLVDYACFTDLFETVAESVDPDAA